ncbi:MAG: glycosyltransferase [Paludibacter sp.]|nr:glycosyltransferase [Paludibacter sp.]
MNFYIWDSMNILHIIRSIDKSTGGPARSVTQICEQLSLLGVDVDLVTNDSPSPVVVNTSAHFRLIFYTFKELFVFSKSLSKTDYSLIHLQHIWNPYIHIVARAARKKGIPYIISPRGMLEPWIMNRHPWKKKMAMWLYQRKDIARAACIHATAESEKDNIRKLGFNNKITVIPNGIETDKIQLKTSWEVNKKILFLSRIHVKKGIELLLESIAGLKEQMAGYSVIIAGEGEEFYIRQLKQKSADLGVSDIIHFAGGVYGDEKWQLLREADFFVLPTFSENFGIVVAEALASGTPVITTTGTPWQGLNSEECGWWIDLSVENLKKALTDALNKDAKQLETMGRNGRTLVEGKYDIRAVAQKMYDFYKIL